MSDEKKQRKGEETKLPPHSIEAEQGVIGCLLLEPRTVVPELVEKLRGGKQAFYHLPHQTIYETCVEMWRQGTGIDLITLQARLKDQGQLESVGGVMGLMAIQEAVVSAGNLPAYLATVQEKWVLRQALKRLSELQSKLWTAEEPEAFVAECATRMGSLLAETEVVPTARPMKEFVRQAIDRLEAHYNRGGTQFPPGSLRTGLNYLDKVLQGILPTDLVFITGRMGTGKTALAAEIIVRNSEGNDWEEQTGVDAEGKPVWAERRGGLPIVVFSMEMTGEALATRMIFRKARVSMGKWNQGFRTTRDFEKVGAAALDLAKANVLVDETEFQTVEQLIAKARRHKEQHGTRLFVLDYVTLVRLQRSVGDKVKDLTEISNQLRMVAKALRVPWLILAQMNRSIETAETWRRPALSDIKDCDAFAADASKVLMLHQPAPPKIKFKDGEESRDGRGQEEALIDAWCDKHEVADHTERPQRLDCYVAKNRFGPTGNAELLFLKNMQVFEDWQDWRMSVDPSAVTKGDRVSAIKERVAADPNDFADVAAWAKGRE